MAKPPLLLQSRYRQDGLLSVSQSVVKDQRLGHHWQLIGGQDFVSKMVGLLEKWGKWGVFKVPPLRLLNDGVTEKWQGCFGSIRDSV